MADHIPRSDAVVALRSFGRRYSEVLSGPPDDDSWERLIRSGSGEPLSSAVDQVRLAVQSLLSFAAATAQLAAEQNPLVVPTELPDASMSTAALIAQVRAASAQAGDALDARSDDDGDRTVTLHGAAIGFDDFVSREVRALAEGVRKAERAIDSAR